MWAVWTLLAVLIVIAIHDLTQKRHAILRNFPIVGHLRYLLEMVGPELRQYIVTSNNEERPFSRDQRRWVYASSKRQNNYFGFGTDEEPEMSPHFLIIKQSAFPLPTLNPDSPGHDPQYRIPCTKVLGAHRGRKKAFRPKSVINISGMSFGSLSAPAIEALNRGAAIAECLHNTGEGAISPYHLHGGELIWQIGTGYFGCRDGNGNFSMDRLVEAVSVSPVKAIEIKLSQGAKPGMGGLLPAAKVTPEIADIRGIPLARDCASPASHATFGNVDEMLDFVEQIAEATGLPVGIKSAVGESKFWSDLAHQMVTTDRGVDFINIDGGEGGTGAAPLVFSDHVALPWKLAFVRVYREFIERGLHDKIVFGGSAKLGFPENALFAFSLGCDMIHVAREAMLSIGCIQAQRCHTGHCPTGVATQSPWLMRGLDPTLKAARVANYITTLRKEVLALARACGQPHPALVTSDQCEILDGRFGTTTVADLFDIASFDRWGLPSADDTEAITAIMTTDLTTTATSH